MFAYQGNSTQVVDNSTFTMPAKIGNYTLIKSIVNGRNPKARYRDDKSGVQKVFKYAVSKDFAKNEVLASHIYRLAQVNTLDISYVEDKETDQAYVVSNFIENYRPLYSSELINKGAKLSTTQQEDLFDNFAVDAFIANYDVIGNMEDANIGLIDNRVVRFDVGGSLDYVADGVGKKSIFTEDISEIDFYLGRSTHCSPRRPYQSMKTVFGHFTDKELIPGLRKVATISNKNLSDNIFTHGPGSEVEKKALANKLLQRKKNIIDRLNKIILSNSTPAVTIGNNKQEDFSIPKTSVHPTLVPGSKTLGEILLPAATEPGIITTGNQQEIKTNKVKKIVSTRNNFFKENNSSSYFIEILKYIAFQCAALLVPLGLLMHFYFPEENKNKNRLH